MLPYLIPFDKNAMKEEYTAPQWIAESGLAPDALSEGAKKLLEQIKEQPLALRKAQLFSYLCENAQLAVDPYDIFQDKINTQGIYFMELLSAKAQKDVKQKYILPLQEHYPQSKIDGLCRMGPDFGHVCPDWNRLLQLGFVGILREAEGALSRPALTQEQKDFFLSCVISYKALITFTHRIAQAVSVIQPLLGAQIEQLAQSAPQNLYQAMELFFIVFAAMERMSGGRVRSLGNVDGQLFPYFRKDLENGVSEAEVRILIDFFFYKFWAAKVPFDQPMTLGGNYLNRLSYLFVEEYASLDIYSPKIHIDVREDTPDDFMREIMRSIRKGNSSFLLANHDAVVKSLERIGIAHEDAEHFILIGCYEASAFGKELPCTGCGSINLAKCLERAVFSAPRDASAEDIYQSFVKELKETTDYAVAYISEYERHYREIYLDAILSATYESAMAQGKDLYQNGAVYNNCSLNYAGIATVVDSLSILEHYVYKERCLTLAEFQQLLRSDWEGKETLRLKILKTTAQLRYGNGNTEADALTARIAEQVAALINNRPNGRGGVFKGGLFSIDSNVTYGAKTLATPDGRHNGDTLSKNLCPTAGMEFNGLTSVIRSVAKIDGTLFSNGSILDIVFHPSAVSDEDGLDAMLALYRTFFRMGGYSMHSNVFDAEQLRKAQANPEEYQDLQVRVCGWNVYFVNLSKKEQDDFIKQASSCT